MNTRQTVGKAPGSIGSVGDSGLADDRFSSAAMVNQVRMISGDSPIVRRPQTSCSYLTQRLPHGALMLLFSAFFGAMGAYAQDATWTGGGGTSDWNTASNWSAGVPTGAATFGNAPALITVGPAAGITPIDTLQFNPGAPAYSFSITANTPNSSGVADLNITGSGIVNLSSNAPTFTMSAGGQLNFNGANATADNAVIVNDDGGVTVFNGNSTAGTANVTNNGGVVVGMVHTGSTVFTGTSTAANSTITTNSGFVGFVGTSLGGLATFNTETGGTFDISGLTSGGMTAGSIEGAGTYQLGSKVLTVGGTMEAPKSAVVS